MCCPEMPLAPTTRAERSLYDGGKAGKP